MKSKAFLFLAFLEFFIHTLQLQLIILLHAWVYVAYSRSQQGRLNGRSRNVYLENDLFLHKFMPTISIVSGLLL